MYAKNQVTFRPDKVKNYYFKFINSLFYISDFVGEFAPFLNIIWEKRILQHMFLQELVLFYSVLLTELNMLLHEQHLEKFQGKMERSKAYKISLFC